MNGIQSVSFLSKLNLYVTMEMYVFGLRIFRSIQPAIGGETILRALKIVLSSRCGDVSTGSLPS